MKIISLLFIYIVLLKLINAATCEKPTYKYLVQLEAKGGYLQSTDLNGNADYRWANSNNNSTGCIFNNIDYSALGSYNNSYGYYHHHIARNVSYIYYINICNQNSNCGNGSSSCMYAADLQKTVSLASIDGGRFTQNDNGSVTLSYSSTGIYCPGLVNRQTRINLIPSNSAVGAYISNITEYDYCTYSIDITYNSSMVKHVNGAKNKLSTFKVANDRTGYFFLDNSTGILMNDYYQEQYDSTMFQGLQNESGIYLRLKSTGQFLYEYSNHTTSFETYASTFWRITYLNLESNFHYNLQPFLFNKVVISSLTSGQKLDVSGTTYYTTNYADNPLNKIIGFSNSTYQFNTTFTIIPVQFGRVAIKDSYGNYLSSNPTDRRGFTIQHLGDWEKWDLIYVADNQYKIKNQYGYVYENGNKLSLSFNSSFASVFLINLAQNCITPSPNTTSTPEPVISIFDLLTITEYNQGFISSNGNFSRNSSLLNITIGDYYHQKEVNITYINSVYFEGIAPPGFTGYQDVRIYNKLTGELLYYGENMAFYNYTLTPTPTETPSPSPSIYLESITIFDSNNRFISIHGYFSDTPYFLNITIGDYYNQKSVDISYIGRYYFNGTAPSGFTGYQDVRIYNNSNGDLLYYGQSMAYYYSEPTPSPTNTPGRSIYLNPLYINDDSERFVSSYGYFSDTPWLLNITIGDYYNQKSIRIYSIDNYYFNGSAPSGFTGYQDVRIYGRVNGSLLYYGQNMAYYYNNSAPTESPTPTSSPSNPTQTTCTSYNGSLVIQGRDLIECEGNGITYCEDLNENTCSTDSSYGTIKCTTKSTYMTCKGNHLVCKSGYLTCSVNINEPNSIQVHDSSSNRYN